MKSFSKYAVALTFLLVSGGALAHQHERPLALAQQIAGLTGGGPYDPQPPMPASDIVQRDARRR